MMLLRKKCTECNSIFNTCAEKPYCSVCIKAHCELSHRKDSIGRQKCNATFDLINRKNKLCMGHYKMLQNFCYVCGDPRLNDDCLSYDDYYYCTKHKPVSQKSFIGKLLNSKLNDDMIEKIVNKVID